MKDRMQSCGVVADSLVCANSDDCHDDHLLFECAFSTQLWGTLIPRCGVSIRPSAIQQEIQWAGLHKRGDGFHHYVYKLALAASLHHKWHERLSQIGGNTKGSARNQVLCEL